MAELQEAQIRAALGRHLDDEEMIDLIEQASQSEDSLAFWRAEYEQRSDKAADNSIADADAKLLDEYRLSVERIEEDIRDESGAIVRTDFAGWVICRQTQFGQEFCDRRVAWTVNRGECLPFLDEMEAQTTALTYAASMKHGSTHHRNLPVQISITLTICPNVQEPDTGVRVGKELSTQHTQALDAVRQGLLAANIPGRDGKAVDTYAAAIDYILWRIHRAIKH